MSRCSQITNPPPQTGTDTVGGGTARLDITALDRELFVSSIDKDLHNLHSGHMHQGRDATSTFATKMGTMPRLELVIRGLKKEQAGLPKKTRLPITPAVLRQI